MIEVSYKGFFTGTTYNKVPLYEKRLKNTTTIAVHRSSEKFKESYWS